MKNKNKLIGILATAAPVLGLIISVVGDWAANKEQDRIIEEKVDEKFADYLAEHEESC